MIKAIVFDFDGVILDSERLMFVVMQEMFQKYHVELPLNVWGQAIGTQHGFDPVGYLEEKSGKKIDNDAFLAERDAKFNALVDEEDVLPGVEQILKSAESLGLKIGLATSSHAEWPSKHLERFGLSHYFQCIKTAG
ncbi:HAD family phosphatase [Terrilactibacillus sp. S3-3]|nr:HAD family phosphatase [Terrilactibacillus sp. S3-3]